MNQIGPLGAKALGHALQQNTSLVKLYLGGNAIGLEGAVCISDALQVNTTLKSLYLWGTGFGPQGARKIAQALSENTSLTLIDIECNPFFLFAINISVHFSITRPDEHCFLRQLDL